MCIVISYIDSISFFDMFLPILFICFSLIILFVIVCIIVNLISKIFTKDCVNIYGDILHYKKEKINISEVSRVYIFLGEVGKHHSIPVKIHLTNCNKTFITIDNPAYSLLFNVKKIFKNAKIKIEEIERKIFVYPLICLLIGIVLSLVLLFTK